MSDQTSKNGHFIISHYPNDDSPTDIGFTSSLNSSERVPEDQYQLKSDIEAFIVTLSDVYTKEGDEFKNYYQRAYYLAKLGLEGDHVDISLANRTLDQLRGEIVVSAGASIRNRLLTTYGFRAFIFCVIITIAAFILDKNPISSAPKMPFFLLMLSGSMVGSWLSLGVRTRSFSFDELRMHIRDQNGPTIRLAFTGVLTLVAGLLMHIGALNISIGTLDSTKIASDHLIALSFGILLGFSEKALVTTLTEKTKNMIS
ncbi:hypothetical protein [Neptunomonas sp.]|uniref:hypothetical protein n=1 Tax=Neptunomonas sp. TaxID=1971898 RepID=UPI00356599D7